MEALGLCPSGKLVTLTRMYGVVIHDSMYLSIIEIHAFHLDLGLLC
jgi:hypothetical protein